MGFLFNSTEKPCYFSALTLPFLQFSVLHAADAAVSKKFLLEALCGAFEDF